MSQNMETPAMTAPLDEKGLLPCPFCGATAKIVERHNPMSKWKYSVDCASTTCGMSGPVEASAADAINAWNRRAYLGASPSPSEMEVEDDGAPWVLLKRGLFWRPDAKGYTGLKCDAGRYTDEDVKGYADHGDGTTRMLWKDAPEVAPSCYDDIARAYYQRRLSDAEAQVQRLTEENEALRKDVAACRAIQEIQRQKLNTGGHARTEAAEARIKALEDALGPFADLGEEAAWMSKPDDATAWGFDDAHLTWGNFRAARTTLQKEQADGK